MTNNKPVNRQAAKELTPVIGHHHQAEPDKPHGWTWYR